MPAIHPVLAALPSYPIERTNALKARLKAEGRPVYDFGTGDPFEPTSARIQQALRDGLGPVCRYPNVHGLPELREAIAAYLKRRFGAELDPHTEVLPSRGSKEAIFHLPLAFSQPGGARDVIVFPTPGYPVYNSSALFAGARAHPVPLTPANDYLLEPWNLPGEIQDRLAILWTNYPHNPSGTLAPADYLARLAEYAVERDVVVVSDECYADVYTAEAPRSLLEFGKQNLLAFHSCSKRSGMTGYRSGFMAGDASLVEQLLKLRPNIGVATQAFVEQAAAAAWSDDQHVAERRQVFTAKRRLVSAFLDEHGFQRSGGDATFFIWFHAPPDGEGRPDDQAYSTRLLEECGIVAIPGSWLGPGGEGFCRLALVPDLETCGQALEAWTKIL